MNFADAAKNAGMAILATFGRELTVAVRFGAPAVMVGVLSEDAAAETIMPLDGTVFAATFDSAAFDGSGASVGDVIYDGLDQYRIVDIVDGGPGLTTARLGPKNISVQ